MAQTESKRELILQNLKTALESIDGEDPYWTSVNSVRRVPSMPTEFLTEEKPGILVLATEEPEEIKNEPAFQEKHDLRVGIVGVLDRTTGDEGTALNRFMADVNRAVMADVTRGGYASMTFKKSQVDVSHLFTDLMVFDVEFAIRYHGDGREE